MYPHSFLWHFLWLAPRALQILIAGMMVRRGLVRDFPIFFTYTVFQIISEGTLFIFDHNAAVSDYLYWYTYWVGLASAADCGLELSGKYVPAFSSSIQA